MATDDRHIHKLHVQLFQLGDEGVASDDVKSGDAHELRRIKRICCLEDLRSDWDCGVDGVGDDVDQR